MSAKRSPKPNARRPVDVELLIVLGIAFSVRLAFILTASGDPLISLRAIDETSYADLAHRFASGDVFFGRDTLWFPPLYPMLLGVLEIGFGPHSSAIAIFIQHALGVATAGLAVRLGRRLGAPRAGLIGGALLAVLPTCIHAEGRLLYTGPLVFATAAFLDAFVRALEIGSTGRAAWAGILLGVAGLFRANALAFVPFGAFALLAPRSGRASRAALAFAAGAAATLTPIVLRNGLLAGEWTPSTANAGMIFATAFAEDALGGRALVRTPEDFGPNGAFHREAERSLGRSLSLGEAASYHEALAWKRIEENPGWAGRLVGRKTLLLLNAHEIDDNLGFDLVRGRSPLLAWLPTPWSFILVPAVIGLVACVSRGDSVARRFRPIALFTLVLGATLLVYFVTSRYRLPLVVPGALLAGFGVDRLLVAFRRKAWRRIAAFGAAGGAAAYFALRSTGLEADPSLSLVAVGAALEERGDHAAALRATDEAIRRNPDLAGAWQNRALSLLGLEREAEALEATSQAIRCDSELAAAWLTRGAILARTGRIEESVEPFRRAVALDPLNPDALANLARALAATGHSVEAIERGNEAIRAGAGDLLDEVRAWERNVNGASK